MLWVISLSLVLHLHLLEHLELVLLLLLQLDLDLLLHHLLLLLQLLSNLLEICSLLFLVQELLVHYYLLPLGIRGLRIAAVDVLRYPALVVEFLNLLVDISFEACFVESIVEILGHDFFLALDLDLLEELLGTWTREIAMLVHLNVLLLIVLLALSLHFLDFAVPRLHVQLSLLLLHFHIFNFLGRVNVVIDEAVPHVLEVYMCAVPL